jgi:hypothetical protein
MLYRQDRCYKKRKKENKKKEKKRKRLNKTDEKLKSGERRRN